MKCQRQAPRVAAVALQHGHWENTQECLSSLLSSFPAPEWIILVDNASPDDSLQRAEHWLRGAKSKPLAEYEDAGGRVLMLKLDRNRGYAAGNNAGIREALTLGATHVLIINNDAYVAPDALGHMLKTLANNPWAGICGPVLVYAHDMETVQCCGGGHTNYATGLSSFYGGGMRLAEAKALEATEVNKELNFICGACQLASREFIDVAGLMDEGYFLYCEEQDWILSAKGSFGVAFAPEAVVWHHEGISTGWNNRIFAIRPALRLARSRLRLAWRHHPWFLPSVSLCCLWALCGKVARRIANTAGRDMRKRQP